MKKIAVVLGCIGLLALCACNSQDKINPFHPEVAAYSSGRLSRFEAVSIRLNSPLPAELQDETALAKLIHLRPKTAVQVHYNANKQELQLQPVTAWERDTRYQVSIDMSALFPRYGEAYSRFGFTFHTLPFAARGEFSDIRPETQDDNLYDADFVLVTADKEEATEIEKKVHFNEDVSLTWIHEPNGKQHRASLHGIPAGNQERHITYSVEGIQAPEDSLHIPAKNTLCVLSAALSHEEKNCICITFSKDLDSQQDLEGLIRLDITTRQHLHIENNQVKLYFEDAETEDATLQISRGILSHNGLVVSQDQTYPMHLKAALPLLEFARQGSILPLSGDLTLHFHARYLRAVEVRVIKIASDNIKQYLQCNIDFSGNNQLQRVGRIVASQLLFLDDDPTRPLHKMQTYALDVSQLFQPEPGAMYRIVLRADRSMSAYPGANATPLSHNQLQAAYEAKTAKLQALSDEPDCWGSYYCYNEGEWNWYERENPCHDTFYHDMFRETNVVATDLALIAKSGENQEVKVWVKNLLTAEAVSGVELTLYNFQLEKMGSATSNSDGYCSLRYLNGVPFLLHATHGRQVAYLRMEGGNSLSVSDFDVSGEKVQHGLKGFIYGERGVWRPGDTLHVSFMLYDRDKTLPAGHPLRLTLTNPLGQVQSTRQFLLNDIGLYCFSLPLPTDAPTGFWTADIEVGDSHFSKRLRVETIKPNRLKIKLSCPPAYLSEKKTVPLQLHTEWLQGTPVSSLKYDITTRFEPIKTQFAAYPGYVFDDCSKIFNTEESEVFAGKTNSQGDTTLLLSFQLHGRAPGWMQAKCETKVYEPSGEFSSSQDGFSYSPYSRYVGIHSPQQGQDALATNQVQTFKIAVVDENGKAQAHVPLQAHIYKVQWYWWWSAPSDGELGTYSHDSHYQTYKTESLITDASGQAELQLNMPEQDWGTYLIRVEDSQEKHSSAVLAYFDWLSLNDRRAQSSEFATQLKVSTDKPLYQPGEDIRLSFPSVKEAKALVTVENGSSVLYAKTVACADGRTELSIESTSAMQPNVYLHVMLVQPYTHNNDHPIRMYGICPVRVEDKQSRLEPCITTEKQWKPESDYSITVSEKNGKAMSYTLAIVDEGLLDITRFTTPNPWNSFYAREALGVRTWDFYNQVIGAYGGRIEQIFSLGGDTVLDPGEHGANNRFTPVAHFEGPFHIGANGKGRHTFHVPNYSGRVRIMVVACNTERAAFGCAETSVPVKSDLMVLGTLPRVVSEGEEMEVPATVFVGNEQIQEVRLHLQCADGLQPVGADTQTLHFHGAGEQTVWFRLHSHGLSGKAQVRLQAQAQGLSAEYTATLPIRPAADEEQRVENRSVAPGETLTFRPNAFGQAGSNALSVEISLPQAAQVAARLQTLSDYPYGCVEQTCSRAFPGLYLNALCSLSPQQRNEVEQLVRRSLERLPRFQTATGDLAYWPGGNTANPWGSIYAAHFACMAEAQGYKVPVNFRNRLLNALQTNARNWRTPQAQNYNCWDECATQAYRLYVLALYGQSDMGAMNRLRESGLCMGISRWLLAGAYAQSGRKEVALTLLSQTDAPHEYGYNNAVFGSELRDQALKLQVLCLCQRDNEAAALATTLAQACSSDRWMSTQTNAVLLCALGQYNRQYAGAAQLQGEISYGSFRSPLQGDHSWHCALDSTASRFQALKIRNQTQAPILVRTLTEGIPTQGEQKAYEQGVTLQVVYRDMQNKVIDPKRLKAGTTFRAEISLRNPSPFQYEHLVLTQTLPSGWELLHDSEDAARSEADYQDVRDNSILSFVDCLPSGQQITLRVTLHASYAGHYVLPPLRVEAMYHPNIKAATAGAWVEVER